MADRDLEAGENEPEDDESPLPSRGLGNFVRENPVAAISGALFVGILLGRLGII
jgi:hypothetical protein